VPVDPSIPEKKDTVWEVTKKIFRYIGEVVVPVLLMGFLRRRKK